MELARRCHAKSKRSQEQCKRAAILGGRVCHIHGGKNPIAKIAAEERMRALVHPALTALQNLIADNDLAAAKYVLDYAGFKATEKVQQDGHVTLEIELVDRSRPALNGSTRAPSGSTEANPADSLNG